MRNALWKRRDDYLVDVGGRQQLMDRLNRITVADHGIDAPAGRRLEERHSELNDQLGFLGVRIPVEPWDE